jgi:hypothetical protein
MGIAAVVLIATAGTTQAGPTAPKVKGPKFTEAAAFDVSEATQGAGKGPAGAGRQQGALSHGRTEWTSNRSRARCVRHVRRSRGDKRCRGQQALAIPSPIQNFEGSRTRTTSNVFGFRVNPPDPNGDVGPNHYVEMINLVFAVYSKTGTLLLGPADTGSLWAGFAVPDCTDPSGDPIVLYDQTTDRWILSQFTTRGLDDPTLPFYNCVAVSQTGDPTGAYFRYAFITSPTRSTGASSSPTTRSTASGATRHSRRATSGPGSRRSSTESASTGLERNKMINGDPRPAPCSSSSTPGWYRSELIGDGLPPDTDGKQPKNEAPAPIVSTQDDGGLRSDVRRTEHLGVRRQVAVDPHCVARPEDAAAGSAFDSIFPCADVHVTDRLPQPGSRTGAVPRHPLYRQRADLATRLPQPAPTSRS